MRGGGALMRFKASGKATALYAAVTALALLLFYGLNYAGNQLPYEVAQKRFADTFDAAGNMSATGLVFRPRRAGAPTHEYCRIASMTLAGATAGHAVVDAVFNKRLVYYYAWCQEVKLITDGGKIDWELADFRYRWGGTTVFAIALRFMSVAQFHALVKIATYAAYLLLAGALLAIGWRALAVVSPLLLLAPFFSGIPMYAEAEHGVTHLWAVLAAAGLALLLANPKWRDGARAPLFCFIAGVVSAYLWLFDGHNFYAVALIGAVAWLGNAHLAAREQLRAATACLGFYIAGFAALFVLDQAVKHVLLGWILNVGLPDGGGNSARGVLGDLGAALLQRVREIATQQGNHHYVYSRTIEGFFPFLLTAAGSFAGALLTTATLAWAGALALVWHQSRHGNHDPLCGVLFFTALALAFSVHFLLPDDAYPRGARYAFTPLALGFSCLFYALLRALRAHAVAARIPPRKARKRRRGSRRRRNAT